MGSVKPEHRNIPKYEWNNKVSNLGYTVVTKINNGRKKVNVYDLEVADNHNFLADDTMVGLGLAASVVVVVIIFTSVFCIKNSFDISITEKTRQYGMLSSIGATRKQIKQNVYYEALILGIIGIVFLFPTKVLKLYHKL